MVRILFGLCSVGLGHAIRSKVIIDHLMEKNDLFILASNKAYVYLKKYYGDRVYNIEGFELVFRKNIVLSLKTLLKNLRKVSYKNYVRLNNVRDLVDRFDPQIVISDWEIFSSFVARDRKIPLISIDNQHYLIYGNFSFSERYRFQYLKAVAILKSLMYGADYYLIMAFPGCNIKNRTNVFAIKPVLRESIINAKPKTKDYIFVYQSTKSYEKLIEILRRINYKFIIYGFEKEEKKGNLVFKKFNDGKEYFDDLVNAKAVMTNGGFTLISEALYLNKPVLVVPIKKHFEQILNAFYVKKSNYGIFFDDLNENHVVDFIINLKQYKFDTIKKWNNEETFKLLDMLIRKEAK